MKSRNGYRESVVRAFFREYGVPEPVAEFQFHPSRKFRFDWAWKDQKLGLECQGGLFARLPGGHNRGAQIRKEHEKRNLAACVGWRILYCEPETLCTKALIDQIRWALGLCPVPDKHIGQASSL